MPTRTAPGLELVTIPNVELCRLGHWKASTGPFDATPEKFAAIVAAQADPEIGPGVIKLGHTGALAELGDSQPALGWIENVRVIGDRLVGDFVDVPAQLAAIIPAAYRKRSVEILEDVVTASGRAYKATLSGVALLGVQAPAVQGLADVLAIFKGEAPFTVAATAATTSLVVFGDGLGTPADQAALVTAAAAKALGEIAAASPTPPLPPGNTGANAHHPNPGGSTTMPPMTDERIRELLGAAGDADVEALLGQARAVLNPAAPAAPAVPGNPDPALIPPAAPVVPQGPVAAVPAPLAPAAPVPAPAAVPLVGGPAAPAAPAAPVAAPVAPAAPVAQAPAPAAPAPVPVAAAQLPAGVVAIDAAALAQLQAGANAGAAALAAQSLDYRERALASHMQQGRIAPASLEHWRTQYDRDPQGTMTLLASLPQTFPVHEIGAQIDVAASAAGDQAYVDFMTSIPGIGYEPPTAPAAPAGGAPK